MLTESIKIESEFGTVESMTDVMEDCMKTLDEKHPDWLDKKECYYRVTLIVERRNL